MTSQNLSIRAHQVAARLVLYVALGAAGPRLHAADPDKYYRDAFIDRAEANYEISRARCRQLKGNAADICHASARRDRDALKAEAEAYYAPDPQSLLKAVVTRAHGDFEVARETCQAKTGNERDVCLKDAEAVHVAAVADAKADRTAIEARLEAARATLKAQYAAARERCDAFSDARRDACLSEAKAHYAP